MKSMENDRLKVLKEFLRLKKGLTLQDFSSHLGVEKKTIERWMYGKHRPHAEHCDKASLLLEVPFEVFLPQSNQAIGEQERNESEEEEILQVFRQRKYVDSSLWETMVDKAQSNIDILSYANRIVRAEFPALLDILCEKAKAGVKTRLLLGDAKSPVVSGRADEEGGVYVESIERSLEEHRVLIGVQNIELRLHATPLYNMIYRCDETMLVGPQIYRTQAYLAPLLHIRHMKGRNLFHTYLTSFEKVWSSAKRVDE